MTRIIFFDID